MKTTNKVFIITLAALLSLTSCNDDEPATGNKPVEKRTVLVVDQIGNIYNLDGKIVKTLPDCEQVTQIITEGEDYFVSGVNKKMKVGYWKNGKWNTLHVDFIDDVEHWTFGIAKWDYNIYLLDPPNVLRNSGIFRLEDCENFNSARHGISVSEGNCFVVGSDHVEVIDYSFNDYPILYYYHKGSYKKKVLPLPEGVETGNATGIYAFDGNHYLACGYAGGEALLWDDAGNIQVMARSYDFPFNKYDYFPVTIASAVEKTGSHIYVSGVEKTDRGQYIATLWTDNVPQHLVYAENPETVISSLVTDMQGYSNDIYVLTQEVLNTSESYSVIWMNDKPIAKFDQELISVAIY